MQQWVLVSWRDEEGTYTRRFPSFAQAKQFKSKCLQSPHVSNVKIEQEATINFNPTGDDIMAAIFR